MNDMIVYQPDRIAAIDPTRADFNPAVVYLMSKPSKNSQRALAGALNLITDVLYPDRFAKPARGASKADRQQYQRRWSAVEWHKIGYQHVTAVQAALIRRGCKTSTINHAMTAIRGVLKEAWRLGFINEDTFKRITDFSPLKGAPTLTGRDIHTGEIVALSRACTADPTNAGARDAAIVGLLSVCGLRRAELAALTLAQFDEQTGSILVHGKGGKDRRVYITGGALMAVFDWLAVRGREAGALFNPILKNGAVQAGKPMTAQAIYNLLKKRAGEAGVADFSPHDFRRTVAGDLLDKGVDLVTVSKILGHSDVNTTSRYDRRDERAKAAAANKLDFPYQRRIR